MASLKRRGDIYYAQWYVGSVQKRASLDTDNLQIAKERLRQIESRLAQGDDSPLPTRTPVGEVVAAFIDHMKAYRPESSWRKDLTYLRDGFGPCCPELEVPAGRARKCWDLRCPDDHRRRVRRIDAACFEAITTAMIADMIADRVRAKGLAPKTANRYREVMCKLFNWAMDTSRVRLPRERNPAAKVARYRERAPEIRFLTLAQIDEQLRALEGKPVLRALVATYIYAGLRREEALRLTAETSTCPRPAVG